MKKVLVLLFAAVALSLPAQAQVKFGLKAGLNLTSISASGTLSDNLKNKAGFFVGPTVKIGLPVTGLSVDASALYDQRSAKVEVANAESTIKSQSLQVPINLRYGVGLGSVANLFAFAGPQFGFNLGDKNKKTTSNAVHQGSKLPAELLPEYFSWLSDLEYNRMQLPKPDLVIYLETTLEISVKRMRRRENATGTHADIHEKNTKYLEKCLQTAELACDFFGWKRIACLDELGKERHLSEKNDEIYSEIRKFLGQ